MKTIIALLMLIVPAILCLAGMHIMETGGEFFGYMLLKSPQDVSTVGFGLILSAGIVFVVFLALFPVAAWQDRKQKFASKRKQTLKRTSVIDEVLMRVEEFLGPFEEQWAKETKLRHALLFGSDAPLAKVQERYEREISATQREYEEEVARAGHDREVAYEDATRRREAEYARALSEREQAYESAARLKEGRIAIAEGKRQSEQDIANRNGDTARWSRADREHTAEWSRADREHTATWSAAYRECEQRTTAAYRECEQRTTAAYRECEQRTTAAWRKKDQVERKAAAKREDAIQEYLAEHPEVIHAILGEAGERATARSPFSYTSTKMLTIPALVELASNIVDGERQVETEEVGAIAKHLHDYVSSPADRDPYPELRDEARRLLRELIKMLN